MFHTYLHRRNDTGQIFYVGKGHRKTRANDTKQRSELWKRIVNKAGGRTVTILAYWEKEEDAFSHEVLLISIFRDMGLFLANNTDGGDGIVGYKRPQEVNLRVQAAATLAKQTPEIRAKMAASANARWAKEDRKEFGRKISLAMSSPDIVEKQERNRQAASGRQIIGIRNARCRHFRCIETGVEYEALIDAAKWLQEICGTKWGIASIHSVLNGRQKICHGYHFEYLEPK